MTRSMSTSKIQRSSRGPNFAAILISFIAITILYFNFQPTPAGADPDAVEATIADFTSVSAIPAPPPLPTTVETKVVENKSDDESVAEEKTTQQQTQVPVDPNVLQGKMSILMSMLLLEKGCSRLEKVSDYTATFFKQERVGGELTDGQVMQMKLRHAPFSVYMKWLVTNKGQQLLYVTGENENKLIVQLGGWKARFPALKLDPNGSLALKENRYPITKAGMLEMSRMTVGYRKNDLKHPEGFRSQLIDNQKFQDRDCYYFAVEYDDPKISETYRKSLMYIDKEWNLPIFVKNYGWSENAEVDPATLDEETLIEFYTFTDINFDSQLANSEFDRENKSYKFR